MSMYLRPWIPITQACMVLVQSLPVVSGASSKNLEFQTNGGSLTWYAPTATPLTLYFNPLHQPKTPVFTKKLSPKVLFCPHCPKFWKLFTQRPQISLWLLSLKDPQFCALHASVWGECCFLKHGQKLENFVFLRQNRAIWWILLGANLIKVMKTKFQAGITGSTDPIVMEELH